MNPAMPNSLQLRDIHLPGPPSLWPPATGWWIAAAMVLAVLIWVSVMAWRRLTIQRQRKQIFGLLEQLEQSAGNPRSPEFLAQLSRLLRRLALMRYPRQQIAPLSGTDWLRFLDASGGDGRFCQGPGRVLADGPYVRDLNEAVDTLALTTLIRDWVKRNTGS